MLTSAYTKKGTPYLNVFIFSNGDNSDKKFFAKGAMVQ